MEGMTPASTNQRLRFLLLALLSLLSALPGIAKIAADFDPNQLIAANSRDLAWRMFASVKITETDPEKIWKIADNNIKNGFKRFPPSPKDIEAKIQQWAKEDAAKKSSQP